MRWYYREIVVVHASRIPQSGPLLVAANHTNALVDALLLMAAVDRPLRLTAKSTLLDHPISRALVWLVGIVPLRRARDARPEDGPLSPERNAVAFQSILDAFSRGEAVLIFPEGFSHNAPSLEPLRSGAGRLVALAHTQRHLAVPVCPVGLTFERKWRPRSRVYLEFGDAILESPPESASLTSTLSNALRRLTLNHPTDEVRDRIMQVASALERLQSPPQSLTAADPPFARVVARARALSRIRERLSILPEALQAECDAFLAHLDAFERELHSSGIPMGDVGMATSRVAGGKFIVRESLVMLVLGPVAIWGKLSHWPPFALARHVGLSGQLEPDERAMRVVVAGFGLTIAWYGLAAAILATAIGGWWSVMWVLTAIPSAEAYLVVTDRLRRALRRVRSYLAFRKRPWECRQWIDTLGRLRTECDRLEQLINASFSLSGAGESVQRDPNATLRPVRPSEGPSTA